jgi:hypothetical protein
VHGSRRYRPSSALALQADRAPMGMRLGQRRIAEKVVGERQENSQALD